jgi:tetratricopeptide (TPR) repeat protein
MKCLDCVSVCPKDALYVGWGAPALLTKPARERARAVRPPIAKRLPRAALTAAFVWATLTMLMSHGGEVAPQLFTLIVAAGVLVIGAMFAGKSTRASGPTLGEELLLSLAFLASLYAFRGVAVVPRLPDGVPLLLAVGMSAIAAYVALLAWRMARKSNVTLQNLALVRERRFTRAGLVVSIAIVPLAAAACARGGWLRWRFDHDESARRESEERANAEREHDAQLGRAAYDRGVAHAQKSELAEATSEFQEAVRLAPDFVDARENLAGMLCAQQRFAEGIAQYREAASAATERCRHFGCCSVARAPSPGDFAAAEEHWSAALRLQPDHAAAHRGLAMLCERRGDAQGAQRHRDAAERANSH